MRVVQAVCDRCRIGGLRPILYRRSETVVLGKRLDFRPRPLLALCLLCGLALMRTSPSGGGPGMRPFLCWGLFPVARGSWAGCVRARVPVVCGPSPKYLRTERIRGPPRCRQTFSLPLSASGACYLSCRRCWSLLVCQRRARRAQRIFLGSEAYQGRSGGKEPLHQPARRLFLRRSSLASSEGCFVRLFELGRLLCSASRRLRARKAALFGFCGSFVFRLCLSVLFSFVG